MTKIRNFWRDETGASAAEYALILSVISGVIVLAATFLGNTITTALADIACVIQAGENATATTQAASANSC